LTKARPGSGEKIGKKKRRKPKRISKQAE